MKTKLTLTQTIRYNSESNIPHVVFKAILPPLEGKDLSSLVITFIPIEECLVSGCYSHFDVLMEIDYNEQYNADGLTVDEIMDFIVKYVKLDDTDRNNIESYLYSQAI